MAHYDVGKYTQRNISKTIDEFWKIHDKSIAKVAEIFNEFSKVEMDL